MWIVSDRSHGRRAVRPDHDVSGVPVHHHADLATARAVHLQIELVEAGRRVEFLARHTHPSRVPVEPDCAAGPRARPGLRIRTAYLFGVFAVEGDVVLQEYHVGLALAFGLISRAFPQLQHLVERQNVLGVVLADAYVPDVELPDVKPQRVGTRDDAHADVSVAHQHALKEVGGRLLSHEGVSACQTNGIGSVGRWRGRGCCQGGGGLEESSARRAHG